MPRSPLKNHKKLTDKSFVRFFWGKMRHSKVHFGYILLPIILHAPEWWLRNPVMEDKKPMTHPHGWRVKGVKLNNLGTSCSLQFIVQTVSLTIIGITEEIQAAGNFPHSKHKLIWSRLDFLFHQYSKSITFIQSNWEVTFSLEFTQW